MVQIDVPVAFGIGSFLADAAHQQLQTGQREHYYHALLLNNIYQIFFFSWIPVYFMLNYFGWETTHMWWHADSIVAYPYYVPIFLIIFFLAGNAGFLLGTRLVRNDRVAANRIVYLVVLAYSAVWILAQTGSTFRLGSYAEWKAGTAPWFYQDGTFLFMLIFTVLLWLVALIAFYLKLRNQGKQLAT
jgi:hypothetical protein